MNEATGTPTFETMRGRSWIDLTLCNNVLVQKTSGWTCGEEESCADHKIIFFNITAARTIFNNFLNTYLRIFYHSFPLQKSHKSYNPKPWLTSGIITSCQHKRDLYLLCRSTDDPSLIRFYKNYCKILSNVIKFAKKKTL